MALKQVSFQAEEKTIDKFDIWCINNKTDRSKALRKFMENKIK